jgi:hypothetical protein
MLICLSFGEIDRKELKWINQKATEDQVKDSPL